MMAVQRLDKVLASTGKWSRREVKMLVRQGRVLVDGFPAASPEQKVDPDTVQLCVNGEEIAYRRYTWLMLNKPAGYLSATSDGRGATVLDLLPQELQRLGLFPVGRLDKDTVGLLLLTNEGGLAHDLLSPRHHVDKVYRVRVTGCLTEEDCRELWRIIQGLEREYKEMNSIADDWFSIHGKKTGCMAALAAMTLLPLGVVYGLYQLL